MSDDVTQTTEVGGDNAAFTALRDAHKKLKKQMKEMVTLEEAREQLLPEVRAEIMRDIAVDDALADRGLPTSIKDLVLNELGTADATPETMEEALDNLGFHEPEATPEPEPTEEYGDFMEVTSLGAQLYAAAHGSGVQSIEERIANAQTPQQVAAIMAEAEANGLV